MKHFTINKIVIWSLPSIFTKKSSIKKESYFSMDILLKEDSIFFDNYHNRIMCEQNMIRNKKKA